MSNQSFDSDSGDSVAAMTISNMVLGPEEDMLDPTQPQGVPASLGV